MVTAIPAVSDIVVPLVDGTIERTKKPAELAADLDSSLLLSWLPVIGDPVTLVAGVFRLNFWLFLLIAGTLRIARYLLIVWMVK